VPEYRGRRRPEGVEAENWFLFDKEGKQMGVLPNMYKKEIEDVKHKITGLPWHHIKVAVISLAFVLALILFAPIESTDEHPVSHLTAVSNAEPYVRFPTQLSFLHPPHLKLYPPDSLLTSFRHIRSTQSKSS